MIRLELLNSKFPIVELVTDNKMTAGSVAVPTIVPLRAPILGQHKTAVDTATKIELHSGLSSYSDLQLISRDGLLCN